MPCRRFRFGERRHFLEDKWRRLSWVARLRYVRKHGRWKVRIKEVGAKLLAVLPSRPSTADEGGTDRGRPTGETMTKAFEM